MIYSTGFGLLAWVIWRLNVHALRSAEALALDADEIHQTRTEAMFHFIMFAVAVLSIAASLLVLWIAPGLEGGVMLLAGLPMWLYGLLGIVFPVYATRRERSRPSRQARAAG
jgi:hypothetical protein